MSSLVAKKKFILTELDRETGKNHNKFWNVERYADNTVRTVWGRVGEGEQSKDFPHSSESAAIAFVEKKVREKTKKGYEECKTLDGNLESGQKVVASNVESIARKQIQTNHPELDSLISRLSKANIHTIVSNTNITISDTTGLPSTPLGILQEDAILEARDLLVVINGYIEKSDNISSDFKSVVNKYLRIVPTKVTRNAPDPSEIIPNKEAIQKQSALLDALEVSLQMAKSQPDQPASVSEPSVFNVKLHLVQDMAVIKRIQDKYRSTMNRSHQCYHLDVKRVYELEIAGMKKAFEEHGKPIGSVMELWHGSRVANILSILHKGMIIPPANASHVAGRLFGNGLYFATQSTKSLNYSYGYWDSKGRDENCFMFLCDVAMGKHFVPKYLQQNIPAGYNSFWAKPGQSGIQNDEIIVPYTYQANPKYLIEFSPGGK